MSIVDLRLLRQAGSARIAAGVCLIFCVAAAFTLAITEIIPPWSRTAPGARPELEELIEAVAAMQARPMQGRVAGGFRYAPPLSNKEGLRLLDLPASVFAATANLERRAREADTADNHAALGLAYLIVGETDRSVEALEQSVHRVPDNPIFQANLSAAYLTRADSRGSAEDWASSLAAAGKAIRLDARLPDAHFNRALALERLHLDDRAIAAWLTVQSLESSGPWSAEAASHVRRLTARLDAPERADVEHQRVRERIEDELLPDWGRAIEAKESASAEALLDEAFSLASQLASDGGDALPRDELMRIRSLQHDGKTRRVLDLARGHALFGSARRSYLADDQHQAATLMAQSAVHFDRAASPYRWWSPIFRALLLRNEGLAQSSIDELERVPVRSLPPTYYHLRARVMWAEGVALEELGQIDRAHDRLAQSVAQYRQAGEEDNLRATQTILAELDWVLGNRVSAWANVLAVLHNLSGKKTSRNYHYWVAASVAQAAGLPEAALEFESARVSVAATPRSRAEAYMQRARTLARLGDEDAARRDLNDAERAVSELQDVALRDRNAADLRIARAELFHQVNAPMALAEADAAVRYVAQANPGIRLPRLLALRAKAREANGDLDGARADLLASIQEFEDKRASLVSPHDRLQAFDDERRAYKELLRLDVVVRRDFLSGLQTAERSRAGAAFQQWSGTSPSPKNPATTHRNLPDNVALVVYETLDDRLLAWVITRERWIQFSRPISRASLSDAISRIGRRIRDGASISQLGRDGALLFENLVQPVLDAASAKPMWFFIPDGPLHDLSIGALADSRGAPLIATRTVGVAASLTSFLAASSRLRELSADDVLTIGDGHDVSTSGLSRLPLADAEAGLIGDLYPVRTVLAASAATKDRLLAADHVVVHFAGHTVLNRQFPLFSRLLLAPDTRRGDGGILLSSDIAQHRFGRTRVVVLATCEAATGKAVQGEGLVSVATAFLAAGVPSVVAGLWAVADDDAHRLFTAFHRELRSRRDAAAALRSAQLEILRTNDPQLPIRAWGGFIALGGTTPFN